ncbi:MAG: glucosamine-6-phosphate deaminase [Clostridia bacterium]
MKIIITNNYEEISNEANKVIRTIITENPNAILGLATGSSPIGLYKNMIKDNENGLTSYKNIKTVNLDEYVGIDETNNQSYIYFMKDNLFNHIDIDLKNVNLPNGKPADLQEECERYTALLNENVQDVQVLGIGANGHIGFNEPNTAFDSTTHIVTLQDKTRADNARFFESLDKVPTLAITMGIKNIMNAKKILIVANGLNKADAVYKMVKGEISETCPASVLQNHPDVVLIIDKDAASKLDK